MYTLNKNCEKVVKSTGSGASKTNAMLYINFIFKKKAQKSIDLVQIEAPATCYLRILSMLSNLTRSQFPHL